MRIRQGVSLLAGWPELPQRCKGLQCVVQFVNDTHAELKGRRLFTAYIPLGDNGVVLANRLHEGALRDWPTSWLVFALLIDRLDT